MLEARVNIRGIYLFQRLILVAILQDLLGLILPVTQFILRDILYSTFNMLYIYVFTRFTVTLYPLAIAINKMENVRIL